MTYYEKLIRAMDKAVKKHPRSTMAMSTKDLRIMAKGKDVARVAARLKKDAAPDVPVIFGGKQQDATLIL